MSISLFRSPTTREGSGAAASGMPLGLQSMTVAWVESLVGCTARHMLTTLSITAPGAKMEFLV